MNKLESERERHRSWRLLGLLKGSGRDILLPEAATGDETDIRFWEVGDSTGVEIGSPSSQVELVSSSSDC